MSFMMCAKKFIAEIFSVLINLKGLDVMNAITKRDEFQI